MYKFKRKFDILSTDLSNILSIIVATDVYTLLLKVLQKNHHIMFKTRVELGGGGGGVKGFLNNVKKLHFW